MPRPIPRLLAISDRTQLPGTDLGPWLGSIASSPIDAVQIREKDLTTRELFDQVRRARELLPERIALLVNRRIDVAIAAGADGVHLPARSLPVADLRRRFGPELLIGVSTHRVEEVTAAHAAGADYVTFGPVWKTPSKVAYGPPPGLEELRRTTDLGVPVLALGGVTITRAPETAAAGAAGIAAIRMFLDPGEPSLKSLDTLFPVRPTHR